ncbi:MAG: tetratricopeptide repeat protein [Planctomycetales bacterium]|nr:tetratricopeptide repeat protein [Planctomycetales bacterium]
MAKLTLSVILSLVSVLSVGCNTRSRSSSSRELTFTSDIAPITFEHCAPCHRPGEAGPFNLISYEDIAARAKQVVEVTGTRYMPPWLPEAGHHTMASERRLSDHQINMIAAWVDAGTPRGDPNDLPPLPSFTPGWQLGEPDLVVRMPEPYELPADGLDVYRNFVIPIPVDRPTWVRGMELRPDNRRIVHHAFMLTNRNGECRRLDEHDGTPGFEGMEAQGAESPDGHFISWQPGKVTKLAPQGTAWLLTPGTDLVLQMHMQPSGKPEQVQASVGFYFGTKPPSRFPVKLVLRSTEIDIPAGKANYEFETRYTLPTDVDLIGAIPHAHYLGKRIEGLALRPDGSSDVLFRIPDWDFNWQGDYSFDPPVRLPKGTTLVQRFSYDNSAANIRNPNSPPKRVQYGLQSVDEMGELWLQVLPVSRAGRETLLRDYGRYKILEIANEARRTLQSAPNDVNALIKLGRSTLALESPDAALPYLQAAVKADPNSTAAQYNLGHALMASGDLRTAHEQMAKVRQMDDKHQLAWHDAGLIFMETKQLRHAEACFRKSLELNAYHGTSLSNLGLVLLQQNKISAGIAALERALQIRPTDQKLIELLKKARAHKPKLP